MVDPSRFTNRASKNATQEPWPDVKVVEKQGFLPPGSGGA